MQVDPAQLEKAYTLIEKGPQTFAAAVFFLISVTLLGLLVKSYQARVTEADLRVKQAEAHKQEVKELLNAERERAVKQEVVAAGFLKMVELGALSVRTGKPRKPPVDPLSPEAPTVSTLKPGNVDG